MKPPLCPVPRVTEVCHTPSKLVTQLLLAVQTKQDFQALSPPDALPAQLLSQEVQVTVRVPHVARSKLVILNGVGGQNLDSRRGVEERQIIFTAMALEWI